MNLIKFEKFYDSKILISIKKIKMKELLAHWVWGNHRKHMSYLDKIKSRVNKNL